MILTVDSNCRKLQTGLQIIVVLSINKNKSVFIQLLSYNCLQKLGLFGALRNTKTILLKKRNIPCEQNVI